MTIVQQSEIEGLISIFLFFCVFARAANLFQAKLWERVISLPCPSGAVTTLGEWPYQEAIGLTIEWCQCFLIGSLLIHVFHYMCQDFPIITSFVLKSFDRVISMSFWEFSKSNVGLQDIFFFKFCPTHKKKWQTICINITTFCKNVVRHLN